jgi:hypothetical protein
METVNTEKLLKEKQLGLNMRFNIDMHRRRISDAKWYIKSWSVQFLLSLLACVSQLFITHLASSKMALIVGGFNAGCVFLCAFYGACKVIEHTVELRNLRRANIWQIAKL